MTEIFSGSFLGLKNQIGLYDTEDDNSYPTWETGLELVVFGDKGVAVSVKGDTYVRVKVYMENNETSDLIFFGSNQIIVGKKGLTLGNEIAASTSHIDWKEGAVSIFVYGNGLQNESTEILFLLKNRQSVKFET